MRRKRPACRQAEKPGTLKKRLEMTPKLTDTVTCPNCKKSPFVGDLPTKNGFLVPSLGDEEELHQVDYYCPDCKKVLLCDTSGKGNLVALRGVEITEAPVPDELLSSQAEVRYLPEMDLTNIGEAP